VLNSIGQDLRFAWRMMLKAPGVTAIALAALALGIGSTSAIFSLVYGVMLRPLPYNQPQNIAVLERVYPSDHEIGIDAARYVFWRDHQHSFESLAAFKGAAHVNLESGDRPVRITVRAVTADFFRVLGISPASGRIFYAGDDHPGGSPVAMLGFGLWKHNFGGENSAIGRSLVLGDRAYTIIGVAPAGMDTTLAADVFVPLDPATDSGRNGFNFKAIGRLTAGSSLAQANADMHVAAAQYHAEHPKGLAKTETAGAFFYQSEIVQDVRPMLLIVLAAVGLVLLIACANVANLLLARVASRHREIAVRVALGATAGRVFRQLLAESLTLSLAGSVLGLVLANFAISTVVALNPLGIPRLDEVSVDWHVTLFAIGLAILTGMFFGVAPAFQILRTDPRDALAEGGGQRSGEGRGQRRLRDALVVIEYGVSVLLLVGALLLTESFAGLSRVDPGFNPSNVMTAQMTLTGSRYQTPAQVAAFDQQLVDRARQTAGVQAAATTNYLPLSGGFNIPLLAIEGKITAPGSYLGNLEWFGITQDFFSVMGMQLRDGRTFEQKDTAAAPPVVIVNQAFVRKYLPNMNPLGQRITIAWNIIGKDAADSPREIVGVVNDIREGSLREASSPQTYVPVAQINPAVSKTVNSIMPTTLMVRTASSMSGLSRDVVEDVGTVDSLLPVFQVRPMQDVIGESIQTEHFLLWLIGGFAIAALVLAAIGIYGVMAYLVTQRTRELGIRAALGASRSELLRMVLGQATQRAVIGLGAGIAAAFALTRLLNSYLYGVKPHNLAAFILAPTLLLMVALVATWLPARRASRVEPVIALRHE
jgi:putative ABC transport system permease protein